MAEQTEKPPRRAGRSPGFPFMDLQTALARAGTLFAAENRHVASYATIVSHLGYTLKSGLGRMTFAALKSYGLIELVGKGEGEERQARVSELGARILLDNRPDSAERKVALQEAALRPRIHRELWQKYAPTLPSDANLAYQLRLEGFTENGVRDFLSQFRKTLAYAGVDALTKIQGDAADDEASDDATTEEELPVMEVPAAPPSRSAMPVQPATSASPQPSPSPVGPRLSFPLAGGNVLEVRLAARVSRRDFEKIKKLIDLAEDSFLIEGEAHE